MEFNMSIELIISTIITGVVGWVVKLTLDKLKEYQDESREWREQLDKKLDYLSDATKADMRVNIVYSCEKCLQRGWITAEELSSILNLHDRYEDLVGHNHFVATYVDRIEELDVRAI
jgi:mannitol-1-phosphate/altronate dehydrogenase